MQIGGDLTADAFDRQHVLKTIPVCGEEQSGHGGSSGRQIRRTGPGDATRIRGGARRAGRRAGGGQHAAGRLCGPSACGEDL
jgi:hypothetical protein